MSKQRTIEQVLSNGEVTSVFDLMKTRELDAICKFGSGHYAALAAVVIGMVVILAKATQSQGERA